MRRSARLNLLRSAFSNWWVAGYLGSFAYRLGAVSPSLTRRLMNIRLRLRTRDGQVLVARLRDVNGPAEVFGAAEYAHEAIAWSDMSFILDAGAHVGGFTLWAAERSPGSHIVSLEPNPEVRELLELNVRRQNLSGRVVILPFALAAGHGRRAICRTEDSAASTLAADAAAGDVIVDTIGLADAIKATGFPRLDLLKIDIEGAEYETLAASSPDLLAGVACCIVECHPRPPESSASVGAFLRRCGLAVTTVSKPMGLELVVGTRAPVPAAPVTKLGR